MSFRNRTGLCGLLIGCTLAVASACGGLDSVKVVITDDAGSGGHPSGGNGASGKGGMTGEAGDNSPSSGAAGEAGTAGEAGAGDAGAAGTSSGGTSSGGTSSGGTVGGAGKGGVGGNGGGGGQPDPMPGPPTVVSVSPRDQSTAANPNDTIQVSFSEPLDPASVTSSSVQIKDASGALVSGSLSYADGIVTFAPKARMNLLGGYTVSVGTAVTDAGKTPMERPFASSFSVRDGAWGKGESTLSNSTLGYDRLSSVALASDGVGRVAAVWAQTTDGTNLDIYAAAFYEGKGWATPVKVNVNAAMNCQYPSVSMNPSGNFIVGWIERDTALNTYSVQVRRNIGSTWDPVSTRVDAPPAVSFTIYPGDVTVAMNANGQAFAAWNAYYYDGTAVPTANYYFAYARRADASGTWDAAPFAFSNGVAGSGVSAPTLAFDAAGNGFIGYQLLPAAAPAKTNLIVYRYVASTGKWSSSAASSTLSDTIQPVAIATNPAGQAVISWGRYTAGTTPTYELLANYFDRAWGTPVVLASTTNSIGSSPTMASATWTGSSFLVAWTQSGGSLSNIYASEYKTAWSSAVVVSDGNHSSSPPWLSPDGRGNALAVWTQQSDTPSTLFTSTDIVFSRFTGATSKWADAGRVSRNLGGYRYPQVVTLADGTAVAGWLSVSGVVIKSQRVIDVLKNDFQ